ncbi:MAG: P-loop containing nucleoside triphosphate hydrolase protein [Monoraphidium minutum]|nr:MAG: P-loop containing nucleoside triphosphate hydrolase protein [Monoraphidium minutum]
MVWPSLVPLLLLLLAGGVHAGGEIAEHMLSGNLTTAVDAEHALQGSHQPPPWPEPHAPPDRTRCGPHYIMLGCQKCGSTSFWSYLRAGFHPEANISSHAVKEIHYFGVHSAADSPLHMSPEGYESLFPPRAARGGGDVGASCAQLAAAGAGARVQLQVVGDASPGYLSTWDTPRRAAALYPDARIVVALRDPTARVLSSHNMRHFLRMSVFENNNTAALRRLPPEELRAHYIAGLTAIVDNETAAVEACLARGGGPAGCWERERPLLDIFGLQGAVWASLYEAHLRNWMEWFPPAQWLVWSSEDFAANPVAHMQQFASWMGLDAGRSRPHAAMARRFAVAYPFDVPPTLVERLRAFFEPHNQRLFNLLAEKGLGAAADALRARFARAGAGSAAAAPAAAAAGSAEPAASQAAGSPS